MTPHIRVNVMRGGTRHVDSQRTVLKRFDGHLEYCYARYTHLLVCSGYVDIIEVTHSICE